MSTKPRFSTLRSHASQCVLALILIFSFASDVQSQEAEQDTLSRSFGVDAFFLNNFLPFESNLFGTHQYLFHFMRLKDRNRVIRQSLDFGFDFSTSDEDAGAAILEDKALRLEYKFAPAKRHMVLRNFYIHAGVDFAGFFSYSVRDQLNPFGESLRTNRNWTVRTGPMLAFEYRFHRRFAVLTEASYHLTFRNIKNVVEIDDGEQDLTEINEFFDTVNLPRTIVLFYNF